jgi:hypothetical protein
VEASPRTREGPLRRSTGEGKEQELVSQSQLFQVPLSFGGEEEEIRFLLLPIEEQELFLLQERER